MGNLLVWDNKQIKSDIRVVDGIKYKTHGYYLINANFINATISRD